MWNRYRFKTYAFIDNRPLLFNPAYPWWCSGYGEDKTGDYSTIVCWLPHHEEIKKYWDDAFDIEFTEEPKIIFSERFAKPDYFIDE